MGNGASMQPLDPSYRWTRFASPEALEAFGAAAAARLEVGEAVCLYGPLGAGKSTFARGLVRALTGPDTEVPSPTFTLVQSYDGPAFPVAHFDLYRLEGAEEAYEVGLDEALDVGAAVVEWSERLGDATPADRLELRLERVEDGDGEGRRGGWRGHGRWREKAMTLGA
jgi:tRNA threonylcarbamoyladenosine biosynthesis protein TsaE